MTDFEKALVTTYITSSYRINESVRKVLDVLESEDTGHIGDDIETKLVNVIDEHLEDVTHNEDKYADKIDKTITDLIPLIAENNVEEVINTIENFEYAAKHRLL